jgi:TPR repeat protein
MAKTRGGRSELIVRRRALVLAMFGLGSCSRTASPNPRAEANSVDVSSVVAGCAKLEDCQQECSQNNAASCVSAGRLYEFGHGVPPDPTRAFELYAKACDADYAGGCYNAAVLLAAGKGVEQDLARAKQLYGKVCRMGSKTSCERAVTLRVGG